MAKPTTLNSDVHLYVDGASVSPHVRLDSYMRHEISIITGAEWEEGKVWFPWDNGRTAVLQARPSHISKA
jgi:hypothetical protein